jgi:hypothetical protein
MAGRTGAAIRRESILGEYFRRIFQSRALILKLQRAYLRISINEVLDLSNHDTRMLVVLHRAVGFFIVSMKFEGADVESRRD